MKIYTILMLAICMASTSCGSDRLDNSTLYWGPKGYLFEFDENGTEEFFLIVATDEREDAQFFYENAKLGVEQVLEIPDLILGIDELDGSIGFTSDVQFKFVQGAKKYRLADRSWMVIDSNFNVLAIGVMPNSGHIRKGKWDLKIMVGNIDLKKATRKDYISMLGEPLLDKRIFNLSGK